MVTEPFVDPPCPPSEEQQRMLLEVGRDYHMCRQQRYADLPSSTGKRGCFCLERRPRTLRRIRRLSYTAPEAGSCGVATPSG